MVSAPSAPQKAKFGLVTIGNAIVDVITHAEENFIAEQDRLHGMKKGSMTLIDAARASSLYDSINPAIETSGGSAGNTIAGFASFGGTGAYIGKVTDDQLGEIFRHDMKAQGVHFQTSPLPKNSDIPTARCIVLVTPDGQRTMNTYLGACVELGPQDIDAALIADSAITYMEGYLFDRDQAKDAFRLAAKTAHEAGRLVSLSLSDPFCVERHRDDFRDLVKNHIDILFANEEEIISLYQVATFEEAAMRAMQDCNIAVLTRSEKGAVIAADGKMIAIAAEEVTVVDTTGAGDQYAAGFLYGFTEGLDYETCGRLGALAASEVISHLGPRPAIPYAGLVERARKVA